MEDAHRVPASEVREMLHDLNGEIFLVRGYVELLYKGIPEGSADQKTWGKIEERLNALQQRVKQCHDQITVNAPIDPQV